MRFAWQLGYVCGDKLVVVVVLHGVVLLLLLRHNSVNFGQGNARLERERLLNKVTGDQEASRVVRENILVLVN